MSPDAVALQHAAQRMGLTLDAGELNRLLRYLELLQKWNRRYNLTAVRDPSRMFAQHLVDSLSIVAPLSRQLRNNRGSDSAAESAVQILDVGSGAGLPGVVLAAVAPQYFVTCIDAVEKKAAFIRQAALELRLTNLSVQHGRVEDLPMKDAVPKKFDVIVSRAFASLDKFVALTERVLDDRGIWLAMKGRLPTVEVEALPTTIDVFHVEQLDIPELDAARCIAWMRRRANGQV